MAQAAVVVEVVAEEPLVAETENHTGDTGVVPSRVRMPIANVSITVKEAWIGMDASEGRQRKHPHEVYALSDTRVIRLLFTSVIFHHIGMAKYP